MKRLTEEQKQIGQDYIYGKIKKLNIKADITKTGYSGYANWYIKGKRPSIKIPTPNNQHNIGTGIHEIAHVELGHVVMNKKGKAIDTRPGYKHEYEAEVFTIAKMEELGIPNKQYKVEAIRYVLENVAQAFNRRHPIDKVPKEIIKWAGIKINKWKKADKIFVPRVRYKSIKDIVVQYK